MALLVTGGAGYIGSHMCLLLAERGIEFVVLDDFSTGRREAVKGFEVVEGTVGDGALLHRLFEVHNISAVMHFAGSIEVAESVANPSKCYCNNVVATQQLLDCMVAHGVGRLVFSSSAAVFGISCYSPMDEDHPAQPVSPYGRSKAMVEQILADYDRAYGLKSVCLRYFNAAGADPRGRTGECHEPETHLIPLVLQVASGRREWINVFGDDYQTEDGTCVRDFVHVVDLCNAHLLSLELLNRTAHSYQFNLGSDHGYSVREVIEAAEEVTGRKVSLQLGARRDGDPASLVSNSSRAKRLLGWTPSRGELRTIIQDAWAWELRQLSTSAEIPAHLNQPHDAPGPT